MAKNNSIIGILINIQKAGNGDKQAIGALKDIQKTIGEATAIFGTLVAAGYAVNKFLQSTVGAWMNYATAVRDVSLVTGQSGEEASRFIQILDDFRIGIEDTGKFMKKMVDNGISPSVESLAALSDKYKGLGSDLERSKFLLDNFGKSGFAMAEAMNAGGDAIRRMKGEIGPGLILDDRSLKLAEEMRLEIDNVADSWDGVKIAVGGVIGELNNGVDATGALVKSLTGWQSFLSGLGDRIALAEQLKELEGTGTLGFLEILSEVLAGNYDDANLLAQAMALLNEETTVTTEKTDDLVAAELELARIGTALAAGLSGEYASAYDNYSEAVTNANQKIHDAQVRLKELGPRTKKNADEWDNLTDAVADGNQELKNAYTNMVKVTTAMIFKQAAAGLDARASLKLARSLGLVSEADYAIADAIEILKERRDAEAASTGDAEAANDKYIQAVERLNNLIRGLPPETVVKVVTQFITEGSPPTTSDPGTSGTGAPPPESCFLAGTLVDTPDGPRAIESLRVGDRIISMDTGSGQTLVTTIRQVFHHPADIVRGYLVINKYLKVTSNHPIATSRGYVPAGELSIGEPLRAWNGWQFVMSIERVDMPVPTYNIQTDHETHNYFADGILAHNKTSEGGVVSGPTTGYWHTLHGTEYVFNQSQFGDMVRAFSNIANGASVGGGGMSLAGATINVNYSGNNFEELLQSIQSAARRL